MINYTVFFLESCSCTESLLSHRYKLIIPIQLNYYQSICFDLRKLNKFILHTIIFYWVRVAFRGKGFRLRKFKLANKLTFNFGHSHWSKMVLDSRLFFFKKIKRQNYLCLSKFSYIFKNFKTKIKIIKKLNMYTKRGLRLKRQFIRRRFGKISQVVSSLH